MVYPKDGDNYLREDAPEEVKKYYEKLQREFSMFKILKVLEKFIN